MLKVDKFSNHIYQTTDNIKTNEHGTVFVKTGMDWIASNGDYIQQTNKGLVNLRTGVNSVFGDPFGDSNG